MINAFNEVLIDVRLFIYEDKQKILIYFHVVTLVDHIVIQIVGTI